MDKVSDSSSSSDEDMVHYPSNDSDNEGVEIKIIKGNNTKEKPSLSSNTFFLSTIIFEILKIYIIQLQSRY